MSPYCYVIKKKLKNVTNSKSYLSFIVCNQESIMITTEKNRLERKSVPLL